MPKFKIGDRVVCEIPHVQILVKGREYTVTSTSQASRIRNPDTGENWLVGVDGASAQYFERRFKLLIPRDLFVIVEFNHVTGELKYFGPVENSNEYEDKVNSAISGKTYALMPLGSIEEMINGKPDHPEAR